MCGERWKWPGCWIQNEPVPENQGNSKSGGGGNDRVAISDDGRFVAFGSEATNLAGPAQKGWKIFVRDPIAGRTELVSKTFSGSDAVGGYEPAMSASGRWVLFTSSSSGLVGPDQPACRTDDPCVYLYDRSNGSTTVASVDGDGEPMTAWNGSISDDGRIISFLYLKPAPDPNQYPRVWVAVRDRQAGTTTEVAAACTDDGMSTYCVSGASVSGDGRLVVMTSQFALTSGDRNARLDRVDVFVWTRSTGRFETVSVSSDEQEANHVSAMGGTPQISVNGRHVTFDSIASNLVNGDRNVRLECAGDWQVPTSCEDVFVRDRVAGSTGIASFTTR